MTIIYNNDGSINYLQATEFIQQGNHLVNEIDVAIRGIDPSNYTLIAVFELPDGTVNQLTDLGIKAITIDGTTVNGRYLKLTEAQTVYAGILQMSLKAVASGSLAVLQTYVAKLTVNPAPFVPDDTTINQAQYNALVQTLNSYQPKYAQPNVRSYISLSSAESDKTNLADGQIILIKDELTTETKLYINNNGTLSPLQVSAGVIDYEEIQ